jgi:hypothetical protein
MKCVNMVYESILNIVVTIVSTASAIKSVKMSVMVKSTFLMGVTYMLELYPREEFLA